MSNGRRMIRFRSGATVFQVRVAAVAIQEGHVLLHRAAPDVFWALPGGRLEIGEVATVALQREMLEETGAQVRIERLLWIAENFFRLSQPVHEIGLYFLVTLLGGTRSSNITEQFSSYEDNGTRLDFRWHPIAELDAIPLVPSFLRKGLTAPPMTTQHIVHDDGDSNPE